MSWRRPEAKVSAIFLQLPAPQHFGMNEQPTIAEADFGRIRPLILRPGSLFGQTAFVGGWLLLWRNSLGD